MRGAPDMVWALVAAVIVAGLMAMGWSRRGGRFRALPGWAAFWVGFAAILIALSRAPAWLSFPMLALLMYASLRDYYFVAPVRTRDRYVILASYLAIPVALYPAYIGSTDTFLATVPVSLFLFIPAFLSIGRTEEGMLDAAGRSLLGVAFFIYCTAHLALLRGMAPGTLELFGVLVVAADLPQRLGGDYRSDRAWYKPTLGVAISLLLTVALGFFLGPWAGLIEEDGGRAGFFVFVAVSLGARVGLAVARDLELKASVGGLARGAFLDRMVPAVYAAPVMFHYLDHFA